MTAATVAEVAFSKLTVEVSAWNVPFVVTVNGVPVPDNVTVYEAPASVSALVDPAFPTVSVAVTGVFPPIIVVDMMSVGVFDETGATQDGATQVQVIC